MKGNTGKTLDVINSCKTKEQLAVALNYVFLHIKQLRTFSDTYNFTLEVFNTKAQKIGSDLYMTRGITNE